MTAIQIHDLTNEKPSRLSISKRTTFNDELQLLEGSELSTILGGFEIGGKPKPKPKPRPPYRPRPDRPRRGRAEFDAEFDLDIGFDIGFDYFEM